MWAHEHSICAYMSTTVCRIQCGCVVRRLFNRLQKTLRVLRRYLKAVSQPTYVCRYRLDEIRSVQKARINEVRCILPKFLYNAMRKKATHTSK